MPIDPKRQRDALLKRYQVAFERYQAVNAAIWKKYQSSDHTPSRREWETVSRALATLKKIQDKIAVLDGKLDKPKRR